MRTKVFDQAAGISCNSRIIFESYSAEFILTLTILKLFKGRKDYSIQEKIVESAANSPSHNFLLPGIWYLLNPFSSKRDLAFLLEFMNLQFRNLSQKLMDQLLKIFSISSSILVRIHERKRRKNIVFLILREKVWGDMVSWKSQSHWLYENNVSKNIIISCDLVWDKKIKLSSMRKVANCEDFFKLKVLF